MFNPNTGTAAPKIDFNPNYNPFKQSSSVKTSAPDGWEELYTDLGSGGEIRQSKLFDQNEDEMIPVAWVMEPMLWRRVLLFLLLSHSLLKSL